MMREHLLVIIEKAIESGGFTTVVGFAAGRTPAPTSRLPSRGWGRVMSDLAQAHPGDDLQGPVARSIGKRLIGALGSEMLRATGRATSLPNCGHLASIGAVHCAA